MCDLKRLLSSLKTGLSVLIIAATAVGLAGCVSPALHHKAPPAPQPDAGYSARLQEISSQALAPQKPSRRQIKKVELGYASWYGKKFDGRPTANGEIYDRTLLTAAHPSLPLPSYVRVTNLDNGGSIIVRVNDRGPFAHNRAIDLSQKAAEMLGYASQGVANVKIDYLTKAPKQSEGEALLMASFIPPHPGEEEGSVLVAQSRDGFPNIGPRIKFKPEKIALIAHENGENDSQTTQ